MKRKKPRMHNLPQFYLTPTLLNSFTQGYDTLAMIRRDKKETTPAMRTGIKLEEEIMNGEYPEITGIIDGGIYQQCLFKECSGHLLFGYADLVKEFKIYDFKSTGNYDFGKYRNATQHLVYTYCADIDEFEYIVRCGGQFYYEPYVRDDTKLINAIKNFENWLKITGTRDIYEQNYKTDRILARLTAGNAVW